MATQKKPSFFCEKCGAKVAQNETSCPHCGRYFASIKCPKCNYSGKNEEFNFGCPRCGYAIDKTQNKKTKKTIKNDPLPLWVYLVVLLLLVLVLVLL